MVDGHTLFDYNVGLNEIIQIFVRKPAAVADSRVAEQSATASEESQSDASENPAVRYFNEWVTLSFVKTKILNQSLVPETYFGCNSILKRYHDFHNR